MDIKKTDLVYLTAQGWWHADLTMFPYLNEYFSIKVLKICRTKEREPIPDYLSSYKEYKNSLPFKNPLNLFFAVRIFFILCLKYRKKKILYEFFENPYLDLVLLFINRNRIIISWHDFVPHSGANKLSYLLRKVFIWRFKSFRLHSEYQYQQFLKRKNVEHKTATFTVLPLNNYGLPQGNFSLSQTYKKVFLFFGTINPYKNLKILIEAFEQINENVCLIIAGQDFDNWKQNYAPLIKQESKYSIHLGFIKDEEVADFFSAADFLVLPYSDTTQSGPLMVAFNYQIPVIASNLEPFKAQITDNETGYFFENRDCESLVAVLKKAIDCNPDQYGVLKENVKRKVGQYEVEIQQSYKRFHEMLTS